MAINPRISVVIPTHNRSRLLRRCVESVLRGTTLPAEVIVSDDGSTDDTRQAVTELARADARLVYLYGSQSGPAAARNRGWRAARAEVVAFIDDDCTAEPGWTDRLCALLERRQDLAGAEGRTRPETDERSIYIHSIDAGQGSYLTCNLALRRSALEKVGGLDETFPFPACEDIDLCLRVIERVGPLGFEEGAVVRHAMVPVGLDYQLKRLRYDPSYVTLFQRHPAKFAEAVRVLPVIGRRIQLSNITPSPLKIRSYLAAFRLANAYFAARDGTSLRERLAGSAVLSAAAVLTMLQRTERQRG